MAVMMLGIGAFALLIGSIQEVFAVRKKDPSLP